MSIFDCRMKELADGIEKMFFDHNFGSATKTDIEIFLFHQYMESLRTNDEMLTNYQIAKELGITIQKVVSLKEREACKFPYNPEQWKKLFLNNMHYIDINNEEFSLLITDRRLYREIESYLEENKISVKYVRNSNVFIANFELVMEMLELLFDGDDRKLFVEARDNLLMENDTTLEDLKQQGGKMLLTYIKDLSLALLPQIVL